MPPYRVPLYKNTATRPQHVIARSAMGSGFFSSARLRLAIRCKNANLLGSSFGKVVGMTKIRKLKSVTPDVADKFLTRHLPYEVKMMRELYPELNSGKYAQLIHNSNVQSFHVHARNLIEFFKNKPPCDFDPRLFTEPSYQPDGNFIDNLLEAKINQQISHLTAQRTAIAQEQLGPPQWEKILKTIEREISRFEKALKPECKEKWEAGLGAMIFTGQGSGASSIFTTTYTRHADRLKNR